MLASLPRLRRPPAPSAAATMLLCALALRLTGCATGTDFEGTTTGTGTTGVPPRTTGSGGSGGSGGDPGTTSPGGSGGTAGAGGQDGPVASACPPGTFARGLDFEQKLACEPLAPAARDAINDSCSVYLGWRDGCTNCTLPPTKWGRASAMGCDNGAGVDNTCTTPTLDGAAIQLFGLNFDGDVNDDDKIHLGFHCPPGDGTNVPGPCAPGSFATSLGGSEPTCVAAAAPVLDHVRTQCRLYWGWRDSCDACTSAPDRWGHVSPTGCTLGAGASNTCTLPTLGGESVQLFGLNTGGDVDGNDKLYFALDCGEPATGTTATKGTCPTGQLITAIDADGTLTCESPAKLVAEYFDAHCTAYFGWRDGCNGCTDPPSKWARLRNGFCTNDNGVDNTCTQTVLGGKTLEMFGLSADGDVNNDDKLYVGFRCD